MIEVEFTDYTYYLAGVGEGVCLDNDNDIHNHNHNIKHHLGKLAAQNYYGVNYCQNTKKKLQIPHRNCKWKILT